jgi:hypothetical protein
MALGCRFALTGVLKAGIMLFRGCNAGVLKKPSGILPNGWKRRENSHTGERINF